MNNEKYANGSTKKRNRIKRSSLVVLSLLVLLTVTVGGTVAFLAAQTSELVNKFNPSEVTCEVTEEFDGTYKKNVNVTNTSEIDAYVRVRLLSYRVNMYNQIIGGTAAVDYTPDPASGWFKHTDGCYYYTKPVAPGEKPEKDLTYGQKITLTEYEQSFDENGNKENPIGDKDGGKQVIEVIAEAIQAEGIDSKTQKPAVTEAWGILVDANGNLYAD